MRLHSTVIGCARALGPALLASALGGCFAVPELPEQLEVATSASASQTANIHTGPPSLANTSWAGFRAADPNAPDFESDPQPGAYGGLLTGGPLPRPAVDARIFVIDFGDSGVATRVRANAYFLPEIYGEEIPVGVGWVPSTAPGLAFRSASYGVTSGDRIGIAILAQVQLNGLYVGQVIIYSWAAVAGDRMDGQFGYQFDFSEGIGRFFVPLTGDQYKFYATRVD